MRKQRERVDASQAEVKETEKVLLGEAEPTMINLKVEPGIVAGQPKKVKIMIDEQEGEESQSDVFVSVNGQSFLIKRGFVVEVPEYVVHALKNCIMTTMKQDKYTEEMIYKDVPRYPFHVIND